MKDQTKVIAALLIGAAAGAALGLLLAPEKGEKTRDDIADYINDLIETSKDKAQTAAAGIKDYSGSVYDKARSRFSGVADTVSDYKEAAVETAREKAGEIKEKAQAKYDEAKSKAKNGADDLNHKIQKA